MQIKYHNDGKEKALSHEMSIEIGTIHVMADSKEEALYLLNEKAQELIKELVNIRYSNSNIVNVDCLGREIK
jgi:hypothetical protein